MYNRQGILTRKGKRSGNPKNRESQDVQFGKELDYLKARQNKLRSINDYRVKVHLGSRKDKQEIAKQHMNDFNVQKQTKDQLQRRRQQLESRLHNQMLDKIRRENAAESRKREVKRKWAKECYLDNQYLSNQRQASRKQDKVKSLKREKEDMQYSSLNYRRNFL